MFDLPMLQFSKHVHNGTGQWLAEAIATFGLLATIWGCRALGDSLRRRRLHHRGLSVRRINASTAQTRPSAP
jgi:hypothetical protein